MKSKHGVYVDVNSITQRALCPQVQCEHSLSSKLFESSQSVMKERSSSLGVSWKVEEFLTSANNTHKLHIKDGQKPIKLAFY